MPVIVLNCCRLFGWSRFVFGQISAEIVAERMKQEGRMRGEGRGEGNRNARCQISSHIQLACFAKLMLIGPFNRAANLLRCGVECANLSDDCRVRRGLETE